MCISYVGAYNVHHTKSMALGSSIVAKVRRAVTPFAGTGDDEWTRFYRGLWYDTRSVSRYSQSGRILYGFINRVRRFFLDGVLFFRSDMRERANGARPPRTRASQKRRTLSRARTCTYIQPEPSRTPVTHTTYERFPDSPALYRAVFVSLTWFKHQLPRRAKALLLGISIVPRVQSTTRARQPPIRK